MAELPESDERPVTGQLAALRSRLVGLLSAHRRTETDLPAGEMDTQTYSEMFLVTLAWTGGPGADTAIFRVEREDAGGGLEQ